MILGQIKRGICTLYVRGKIQLTGEVRKRVAVRGGFAFCLEGEEQLFSWESAFDMEKCLVLISKHVQKNKGINYRRKLHRTRSGCFCLDEFTLSSILR
ncbi:hypothetical protein SADUNF_Sadunf02G0103400 [Salix dunnii]|uniref:Uncharacterized protein n=1 Tax=Salix dunnii TaxID=1413687 RepID=A0A835N772_9ROSI|nr:hypothetical protein SADUNF_Sadunf02G0103400 [Salix dunnii]